MDDISVWVEAILKRDEAAIAADWLKEQPSATVAGLLLALKAEVERATILVWACGNTYAEGHWSERRRRWLIVRLPLGMVLEGVLYPVDNDVQVVEHWVELEINSPYLADMDHDLPLLTDGLASNWEGGTTAHVLFSPRQAVEHVGRCGVTIARAGTAEGKVLVGAKAQAWWHAGWGSIPHPTASELARRWQARWHGV